MNASSSSSDSGSAPDDVDAETRLPEGFAPSAPPAPALDSAQRSALRAQAHGLSPVVIVSESGLTPNLFIETDRALSAHGLIKVRVFGDDREARAEIGRVLCDTLGCAPVQSIGKLLVLWRPALELATPQTPVRRRKPAPTKRQAAEGKTVGTAKKSRKTPAASPSPMAVGSAARGTGRTRAEGSGGRGGFGGQTGGFPGQAAGAGFSANGRAARPTTSGKPRPGAGKARQAPSRIAKGAVNPSARPRTVKAR